MTITATLRQMVKTSYYTSTSLASLVGISEDELLAFIHGKADLSGDALDRLAECLGGKLMQTIKWDEYEDKMIDSPKLDEELKGYEESAWESYADANWQEVREGNWDKDDAWEKHVKHAWPDARGTGSWSDEQFDDWCYQEYGVWLYEGGVDEAWKRAVYEEWKKGEEVNLMCSFFEDRYMEFKSLDYVILVGECDYLS